MQSVWHPDGFLSQYPFWILIQGIDSDWILTLYIVDSQGWWAPQVSWFHKPNSTVCSLLPLLGASGFEFRSSNPRQRPHNTNPILVWLHHLCLLKARCIALPPRWRTGKSDLAHALPIGFWWSWDQGYHTHKLDQAGKDFRNHSHSWQQDHWKVPAISGSFKTVEPSPIMGLIPLWCIDAKDEKHLLRCFGLW